MNILFEDEAELYLWDFAAGDFRNDGVVTARVTEQEDAPYTYWLSASNEQGLVLAHKISSEMNQRFSHKMFAFTWNHISDAGAQSSWLFRFPTEEDYNRLLQIYTQALWQTNHQMPWSKIKVRRIPCHECKRSSN